MREFYFMKINDIFILKNIIRYCSIITDDINRFGNSLDSFRNDNSYQQTISFSIFQIGELINKLPKNLRFKLKNKFLGVK
jgi:uncharacterized protein with HEPN domain